MDRRRFLLASLAGVLTAPLAAESQQAQKVWRIGYLSGGSESDRLLLLTQSLRELGYAQGQNLVIEPRYAEGDVGHLPSLVAEMLRLNLDLIVVIGTPAARTAKRATTTIPLVFSVADNPVENGLVVSLARPGGNLTGFAVGNYHEKQLQALKEVIPRLLRVSYLRDANYGPWKGPAQALGLKVQVLEVRVPDDLDGAFAAAIRGQAGALLVENAPMLFNQYKRIADLAIKSRLPAMGYSREFAELGGLLAFGARYSEWALRLSIQVDKILKGVKPADLPIEQPTKFYLAINLKTAKALGLTIPPLLLLRADQVIE
jgi:putative ABC transport system substrate-binding protein